jgi:hypothetical protein
MDSGDELRAAWGAILEAGGPAACPEAMEALDTLPESAEYNRLPETMAAVRTKIDEVRQARRWGIFFADQYRNARKLAEREGRNSS